MCIMQRISAFQKILQKREIDFSILFNNPLRPDANFVYLSSLNDVRGFLVIPMRKASYLAVNPLEYSIAKRYSLIRSIYTWRDSLKTIKQKEKGKKIGISGDMPISMLWGIKKVLKGHFVNISDELLELRAVKSGDEIKNLKKACKISDLIMGETLKFLKPNVNELDARRFIDKKINEYNCVPSFPAIVATSINSKNPHHRASKKKLKGFTIIDFGVKYNNYCSDVTRTFYIGRSSRLEREFYNKLLDVQKNVIKKLREGEAASLAHNKAKEILGDMFVHSLGHGIGLSVSEYPFLSPKSTHRLKAGMVFTVEPGMYGKRYGVRIEDDILLTEDGAKRLTRFDKELIVV